MSIPRLRADVSLLIGMDDQPLAFDGATGRYHRLSGSAVATLRLLDGTRTAEEVAEALAAGRRQEAGAVREELAGFLGAAERAGLIERVGVGVAGVGDGAGDGAGVGVGVGAGVVDTGEARGGNGSRDESGAAGGAGSAGGADPRGGSASSVDDDDDGGWLGFAAGSGRAGPNGEAGPSSGAPTTSSRPLARRRSRVLPRFVVTRHLPQLLEPLAVRLRTGHRAPVLMAVLAVLGVAGTALGVAGFWLVPRPTRWDGSAVVAGVVFLALVCVHEAAHALACQVQRAPVRAAGFALLFWFVPVAYVDRTDAYRIRRRPGRVALALAGPLCDGVFMGTAALVAAGAGGQVADVAGHLLAFQLLALLINVNPLLPSDLYVAVEAAFGLVDPRGRALALLSHRLRRRALPPHLAQLSRRVRWVLLGYGSACAAYLILLAGALVAGVAGAVLRIAG